MPGTRFQRSGQLLFDYFDSGGIFMSAMQAPRKITLAQFGPWLAKYAGAEFSVTARGWIAWSV
ncbi:MAG: hypothetical protein PHG06_09600 [Parabacteroides sp.]|nr:hypothetical protein [Parabacteroides sp.]